MPFLLQNLLLWSMYFNFAEPGIRTSLAPFFKRNFLILSSLCFDAWKIFISSFAGIVFESFIASSGTNAAVLPLTDITGFPDNRSKAAVAFIVFFAKLCVFSFIR